MSYSIIISLTLAAIVVIAFFLFLRKAYILGFKRGEMFSDVRAAAEVAFTQHQKSNVLKAVLENLNDSEDVH